MASDDRLGRVRVDLDADPGAARRARSFLADTLTAWELEPLADVAVLLVSELATNALRYAPHDRFSVSVAVDAADLVVEVEDRSETLPFAAQRVSYEAEGGRGLVLVESLSQRWGCRPVPGGKVVWFALGIDSDPGAL